MPDLLGMLPSVTQLGFNAMGQAIANNQQANQQQVLNIENARYNKEMTDYYMNKQLEFWDKTNYAAQVAQLTKAGLNPALLYGKGGPGGSTNISTSSGSNASATGNAGNVNVAAGMQMGMQLELLKAQKENIEADTKLKDTEANKKAGVDTQESISRIDLNKASIKEIAANIENKEAQTALYKINTDIQELEYNIKNRTQNFVVSHSLYTMQKTYEELQILKNEHKISDATVQNTIDISKAEVTYAYLKNELMRANINLTKNQALLIWNKIIEVITNMPNDTQRTSNDTKKTNILEGFKDIEQGKLELNQINSIVDKILEVGGK